MNPNRLDPLERDVADLLTEATSQLRMPDRVINEAWRRGRRRRRLHAAAGSASTLLVIGALTAAALTLAPTRARPHTGHDDTLAAPAASGQATGAPATCEPARSPLSGQDRQLAAVCLAVPVDGYTWTTSPAGGLSNTSLGPGDDRLVRNFAVEQTPDVHSTLPGGVTNVTPTGREVTVIVARHGAFATTPDAVRAAGHLEVTGTVMIRGVIATVARDSDNATHLLVTLGGFDVECVGFNFPHPSDPTPVSTLVDVVNHLHGL